MKMKMANKSYFIVNRTGRRLKVVYRKALQSTVKVGVHAPGVGVNFESIPRPEAKTSSKKKIDPNVTCKFFVNESRGLKFDFCCKSKEKEGRGWETNVFILKGYTQEIGGQPHNLL